MKQKKSRKPFSLSLGSRTLTFTPLGTRFVLICLGVGAAAVNSGSNLLYLVVAMMLTLMLISGVLSEQTLRNLRVGRRVPEEIYAGSPFPVRLTVQNGKTRVPSFALAVSEFYPGGGLGQKGFVPRLGPGESSGAEVTGEVGSRGSWVLSGFEVTTRFPFGLFQKSVRLPRREVRTVYPRIRPLDEDALAILSGGLGERAVQRKGQGVDIRGLREYGIADEARLIHWKSSARLSMLMAKEFELQEKTGVCVVFDNLVPRSPAPDYPVRFEEAVSLAASVVRHVLLVMEQPVSFVSRDREVGEGVGRGHYLALMEVLAGTAPVTEEGREGLVAQALGGPSVLVLVDPGAGWARHAGSAGLVLEAGR